MNKTAEPPPNEAQASETPSRTATVIEVGDCRYGPMLAFADDGVITRSLQTYGEWSEQEIDDLSRYVRDDTLVLDVGANIGTHALAFAKRKPRAAVWGFEPQPLVSSLAWTNCARNGADNVSVLFMACGDEPGEVVLSPPLATQKNVGAFSLVRAAVAAQSSGAVGDKTSRIKKGRRLSGDWSRFFAARRKAPTDVPLTEPIPPLMRVRVAPLDSLRYPRPVSLIKIDVEGMEPAVLAGAEILLARDRPVVFFETLSTEDLDAPFALLGRLGYKLYWMETHQFNRANFRGYERSLWAETELGVLALPSGVEPHTSFPLIDGVPRFPSKRQDAKFGVCIESAATANSASMRKADVLMTEPEATSFWDTYFDLKTIGGLKKFAAMLATDEPIQTSLRYYINTWASFIDGDPAASFDPTAHVSLDRSTILYGSCPVIFEGTNSWACKVHFSASYFSKKLALFEKQIHSVRTRYPNKKITLFIVPEKDYILSACILDEQRFTVMRDAIYEFGRIVNAAGVDFVFDGPIAGIAKFVTLADFEYPDSHLSSRLYFSYFGRIAKSFGGEWANIEPKISFERMDAYGDLSDKLSSLPRRPYSRLVPEIKGALVSLISGSDTFTSPLGNTWQLLENAKPLCQSTVCILGDSHSSIYGSKHLTYLMASTFRECAFYWNPCGVRGDFNNIAQDHILLEMSMRFLF